MSYLKITFEQLERIVNGLKNKLNKKLDKSGGIETMTYDELTIDVNSCLDIKTDGESMLRINDDKTIESSILDNNYAKINHTHSTEAIEGLSDTLEGKADKGHTHDAATTGKAGFLSGEDKSKIDDLPRYMPMYYGEATGVDNDKSIITVPMDCMGGGSIPKVAAGGLPPKGIYYVQVKTYAFSSYKDPMIEFVFDGVKCKPLLIMSSMEAASPSVVREFALIPLLYYGGVYEGKDGIHLVGYFDNI